MTEFGYNKEQDRRDVVMRLRLVRKAIDEAVDVAYVAVMMEGLHSLILLRQTAYEDYLSEITLRQCVATWRQLRATIIEASTGHYSPNLLTTDMHRFQASVERLEDAILAHND